MCCFSSRTSWQSASLSCTICLGTERESGVGRGDGALMRGGCSDWADYLSLFGSVWQWRSWAGRRALNCIKQQQDDLIIAAAQLTTMSRSQPKPKIIYRTLEDLIKGSTLPPSRMGNELRNAHSLRTNTEQSLSIKKTNSKHSLQLKEQPPNRAQPPIRHEAEPPSKPFMPLKKQTSPHLQQVEALYQQMETSLNMSKLAVLQDIQQALAMQGEEAVGRKVQELEKMADYLKHIVTLYITEAPTEENQSIDRLSVMNQKRKVTGRCTRNPPPKSIYETVLARRA